MLKIFKKNDYHEFKPLLVEIEQTPQNPLGKTILWIIVGIIFFGILWVSLAKVDIVVSANGKIIPNGEIKILKPLESGVVSKILVKEGQKVKFGDPLILIDPSVTSVNLQTKQENLNTLNNAILRLKALIDENEEIELNLEEKRLFLEQLNDYKFKKSELNEAIKSINYEIKRLKMLKKFSLEKLNKLEAVKDIIALKDYEEAKKEFDDYSVLLNTQIAKLNELKSKFNAFVTTTKSAWLDELINKTQQANLLNAEINTVSFQTKQQIISSPANGYVGKLLVHTIGSAVNSGDQLITIIPNNEKLIAKANVLNKDIGFLNLGQNVAIKVETFNFQKYGKIDGNLTHIANDSIKDEKLGEIYEIKVDLSKNYLFVDGQEKKIEPGMNITAEIKVSKRRVIELFIYPIIRYLDEGLSVR